MISLTNNNHRILTKHTHIFISYIANIYFMTYTIHAIFIYINLYNLYVGSVISSSTTIIRLRYFMHVTVYMYVYVCMCINFKKRKNLFIVRKFVQHISVWVVIS